MKALLNTKKLIQKIRPESKESTTSDQQQVEQSPYMVWLDATREHDLKAPMHAPKAEFRTTGRLPISTPVHKTRLADIQHTADIQQTSFEAPPDKQGDEERRRHRDRAFVGVCCQVANGQEKIESINPEEVYRECGFFKACSHAFVRELVKAGGNRAFLGLSFGSGETIYQKGDRGHSLFLIARGTAVVVTGRWPRWEEKDIGVGSFVGDLQVLGIVPQRLETVRAKTPLHVFEVRQAVFTKLLKRSRDDDAEPTRFSLHRSPSFRPGQSCFPEERRHFESEAKRTYLELNPGKRVQKMIASAHAGDTFDMTAVAEANDTQRAGRPGSLLFKMPAGDLARNTRPTISPTRRSQESPEVVQAQAREMLKKENFIAGLINSLRADTQQGCKMPADTVANRRSRSARSGRLLQQGRSSQLEPCWNSANVRLRQILAQDPRQEDGTLVQEGLEVDLIPPLEMLGSVQKHSLLRHLRALLRAKKHDAPTTSRYGADPATEAFAVDAAESVRLDSEGVAIIPSAVEVSNP